MSAYDALTPAVRAAVDRRAAELVERDAGDLDIEDVREALAARVITTSVTGDHGTGH